jgi:hypothetical protein
MNNPVLINNTCEVGGLTYSIVYNDRLLDQLGDRAQISIKEQVIRLRKFVEGVPLNGDRRMIELLHEVLHAIEDATACDLGEKNIIVISNCLGQFLKSIGIMMDFSNILEEID